MKKFTMTTTRVHEDYWAVNIDLKDAYLHVPIHVRSRRLLRFALNMDDGLRIVQCRTLLFRLVSSPRVFTTKVMLPVGHSAHLRAGLVEPGRSTLLNLQITIVSAHFRFTERNRFIACIININCICLGLSLY